MATLHMDTESVRLVSNQMAKAVEALQETLLSLDKDVSRLGGVWMGNSANEFRRSFLEWSHHAKRIIEDLERLKNRLESEIAEWESMASKLT